MRTIHDTSTGKTTVDAVLEEMQINAHYWKTPMAWRVSCKLQHTWTLRESWTPEGSSHRMTKYKCNFCPETMVVEDVDRIHQQTHILCRLGVHEWDRHCACYCDVNEYCARLCGAERQPDGTVLHEPGLYDPFNPKRHT